MTTCRSCGAQIFWARTSTGRSMPLDSKPTSDGNVSLGWVGGEHFAIVLGPADAAAAQIDGQELYTSHFATCPNAATHRRPSSPRTSGGKPGRETERSAASC